jgi:alkylation response protein AidB-like acyl-CoA dehydrogenase
VRITERDLSPVQSTANKAADRILSDIKGLAPTIAARAGEAEAARRIPADILRMLKSTGIFRMTAPQVYGGLELDCPVVTCVLQALAKIDGSIGWISTLASGAAMMAPLLPRETCEDVYRSGPDRLFAAAGQPAGTAVAETGGLPKRVYGWSRLASRWLAAPPSPTHCHCSEDCATCRPPRNTPPSISVTMRRRGNFSLARVEI